MNIEEQIKLLQLQLDVLREECKQKPETKYPIYMQSISDKTVVKFTSLSTGTVVVTRNKIFPIGYSTDNWYPHTDTNAWKLIIFDKENNIADKQLVECWDKNSNYQRYIKFYDAKYQCTFTAGTGERKGGEFDSYKPISYTDYPQWAIEIEDTLKD